MKNSTDKIIEHLVGTVMAETNEYCHSWETKSKVLNGIIEELKVKAYLINKHLDDINRGHLKQQ